MKVSCLLLTVLFVGCTSYSPRENVNDNDTIDNKVFNDKKDSAFSNIASEHSDGIATRFVGFEDMSKSVTFDTDSTFYVKDVKFYHNSIDEVKFLIGSWTWDDEFCELQFWKDMMSWPESNLGELYPYYVHNDTIVMPDNIEGTVMYKYFFIDDTLCLKALTGGCSDIEVWRFNPDSDEE